MIACVQSLCETLQDGDCILIELALYLNDFTEQGKNLLRDVERTESCKARSVKIYM